MVSSIARGRTSAKTRNEAGFACFDGTDESALEGGNRHRRVIPACCATGTVPLPSPVPMKLGSGSYTSLNDWHGPLRVTQREDGNVGVSGLSASRSKRLKADIVEHKIHLGGIR